MKCLNCQKEEFTEKIIKGYLVKVCNNCKLVQFYSVGHNGIKAKLASTNPKLWAEFEEFWSLYPNHKGGSKQFIFDRYKANPVDLTKLKIILPLQIEDKKTKCFDMPMPATYLNQRRWEEQPISYGFNEQKEKEKLLQTINNKINNVKQDLHYKNISKEKSDELLLKIKSEAEKHGFKWRG